MESARIAGFSRDGQSTLEMSAALVLLLLLLVGSVRIFVWLNERMVARQIDYEHTTVRAGNTALGAVDINDQAATNGLQVDESAYPALNVFQ